MKSENDIKNERLQELGVPFHVSQHVRLGPILGMLILVLAFILGGLFLWGSILAKKQPQQLPPLVNNEPETPRAQADTHILETTSASDDIGAIEADITSTNLDLVDQDLQAVDNELDATSEENLEVQ